jgi:hypothetical protein
MRSRDDPPSNPTGSQAGMTCSQSLSDREICRLPTPRLAGVNDRARRPRGCTRSRQSDPNLVKLVSRAGRNSGWPLFRYLRKWLLRLGFPLWAPVTLWEVAGSRAFHAACLHSTPPRYPNSVMYRPPLCADYDAFDTDELRRRLSGRRHRHGVSVSTEGRTVVLPWALPMRSRC